MDRDTSTEKAFFELNHAQVFVYVLMTVISILFLFITNAYLFRMNFQDWSPMPIPTLLWFNTACLLLASIGMAWSKSGAKVGDLQKIKVGLVLGGIFAVIFVSGQSLAWQELNVSGYFLSSNPANTFFYLITALHAFHILGGLVAWVMVTFRVFKGDAVMLQPQSIGLLGAYWYYLLLVWGILFAMLITT